MIKIFEPRYRDKKVLLANYRLCVGKDVDVEIVKGSYKGIYRVKYEDIKKSPTEPMKTRQGGTILMKVVSLNDLERVSDGGERE